MTSFAIRRVTPTPEAQKLIEHLVERHGPVAFFQFGGCREGGVTACLTRAELLPSDEDIKIGEVAGAPFYVNSALYSRAGRPTCVLDIAPGAIQRLPLEGLEDYHFVTRPTDAAAMAQPA